MPSSCATSFCVASSARPMPKRSRMILRSRSESVAIARMSISRSASSSSGRLISSGSVPRMSESSSSLPSQSVFSGSSMETSVRCEAILRRCMRISFSMQREAYVASLIFLSGLKERIALISPIVPMEIRSSMPTPELSNRLAMNTTRRRLCSISKARASALPARSCSSASRSASRSSGGGIRSLPPM